MIPLKLELKNFLSYGDIIQNIDLSNYSLICLSGKNGNGKSALLDAITWSIWGQARKIAGAIKPDSGLLRLGQTKMLVSLEFEFSNQIYRVRREYAKTYGKPYIALDFELLDKNTQKFISLTDKTIRATQTKIENLLGLDYETFINSAFLRQGLADEFSKKSSKERKQILANILGLSRFDKLQQLANEKAKSFINEKNLLTKLLEENKNYIETNKEIHDVQNKNKIALEKLNSQLADFSQKLEKLEKNKIELIEKKHQNDFLINEQKNLQQEKNKYQKQIILKIKEWKTTHAKLLNTPNIEKLNKDITNLKKQDKNLLKQQQKNLELHDKILQKKELYQKHFSEIKNKLEEKNKSIYLKIGKKDLEIKQIINLTEQNQKIAHDINDKINQAKKELINIEKQLKNYNIFEKNFKQTKDFFVKRKSFYQSFIQRGNWIKTALNELEQKKHIIQNTKNPSCPLCEQVLTQKRKNFLYDKFKSKYSFLKHRFKRLHKLITQLKEILFKQHEELQVQETKNEFLKQQINKKTNIETEVLKWEQEIKNTKNIIKDLTKRKTQLTEICENEKKNYLVQNEQIEEQIKNKAVIKEIITQLKQLKLEKEKIQYDNKLHLKIQNQLNNLEKTLINIEKLKEEHLKQNQRRNQISNSIIELKNIKTKIFKINHKLHKINFKFKEIQKLETDIGNLKKRIQEANIEKEKILQKIGNLESELKRIEQFKKDNKIKSEKIKTLEEEISEYQILTQSFGKNGIQALLIENAIPQIEEEANNILTQLSDNQTQVFIESLRDLKNGGVKETLDIQISDNAGIRPYEMFSGGEAFRVDFALRIAISKLLARRAGTPLQTLIIDEGFGSQDEEGLARLMDAIHAIQNDFSKIIVVSHLAHFKDNFPVHFIIEKNVTGSSIKIEERG
ncbi:AAA family ATPase [Candidatus Dependentiae bacterium]|nr:AAA family ATPase [Candidatus Dependentiae bacterium]